MIMRCYSIMDLQVGHYAQPFYAPSHGAAIRMFADHVRDPQSMPGKHPKDFALYHLADLDDETGQFTNANTPSRIALATEFASTEATSQLDITEAIARKRAEKKGA